MIFRLIILILVLWAGYALVRYFKRLGSGRTISQDQPTPMVACKLCGTHLPSDRAIHGNNGIYCCLEHLEKDQQT